MSVRVFSRGPIGPATATLKSLSEVDVYVARIRSAGHVNIRVGNSELDAKPYHDGSCQGILTLKTDHTR